MGVISIVIGIINQLVIGEAPPCKTILDEGPNLPRTQLVDTGTWQGDILPRPRLWGAVSAPGPLAMDETVPCCNAAFLGEAMDQWLLDT